jgi:small-conductance mechanosensitive channel
MIRLIQKWLKAGVLEEGVVMASDKVRDLAVEVVRATARVLASPRPDCHVTSFGDSAVNLILRFWIADPQNGVTNIRGDVLLGLWDAFGEHRIEFPFPQRELHIRDLPAAALSRPLKCDGPGRLDSFRGE